MERSRIDSRVKIMGKGFAKYDSYMSENDGLNVTGIGYTVEAITKLFESALDKAKAGNKGKKAGRALIRFSYYKGLKINEEVFDGCKEQVFELVEKNAYISKWKVMYVDETEEAECEIYLFYDKVEELEKKTDKTAEIGKADKVVLDRSWTKGIFETLGVENPNIYEEDIFAAMDGMSHMLVSVGVGYGEDRLLDALRMAVAKPVVKNSIEDARGAIMCYACENFDYMKGAGDALFEMHEGFKVISEVIYPVSTIIQGAKSKIIENDGLEITLLLFFD